MRLAEFALPEGRTGNGSLLGRCLVAAPRLVAHAVERFAVIQCKVIAKRVSRTAIHRTRVVIEAHLQWATFALNVLERTVGISACPHVRVAVGSAAHQSATISIVEWTHTLAVPTRVRLGNRLANLIVDAIESTTYRFR